MASSYAPGHTPGHRDRATRTNEARLRRMAERQGLRLVKSKRRDPLALDFGKYMLVDTSTDTPSAGAVGLEARPEFSLADVEAYLTRERV